MRGIRMRRPGQLQRGTSAKFRAEFNGFQSSNLYLFTRLSAYPRYSARTVRNRTDWCRRLAQPLGWSAKPYLSNVREPLAGLDLRNR